MAGKNGPNNSVMPYQEMMIAKETIETSFDDTLGNFISRKDDLKEMFKIPIIGTLPVELPSPQLLQAESMNKKKENSLISSYSTEVGKIFSPDNQRHFSDKFSRNL